MSSLDRWQKHLSAYSAKHPDLSLKQCMIDAKKTYVRAPPKTKPVKVAPRKAALSDKEESPKEKPKKKKNTKELTGEVKAERPKKAKKVVQVEAEAE